MHDKFYVIHNINNPKEMVRGDGGFTEGMLFVIFFDKGDAIPPHPPSIRALYIYIYSQVHKYWDIDTILTFLALYTTTMDFK